MGLETEQLKIKFSEYQQPALPTGKYQITLTQKLSTVQPNESEKELLETIASKTFFVAGERFRIAPAEITAVFPPAYNVGEHANVFPHIMINRNTLPWERRTSVNDDTTPWLALLVIYENEEGSVTSKPAKLRDVKTLLKIDALEPAQADTDTVQVLGIKKELLKKILPAKNDLRFLTHVREGVGTAANMAVLIGNRLPLNGGASTVYLVSLENRYNEGDNGTFDYDQVNEAGEISLVQLHSWSFTCTKHEGDFASILKKLNCTPATLRLPDSKLPSNNPNLKYLQQGFYPLPHKLREGSQTVSWYHGPLAPAPTDTLPSEPTTCTDSLLHYYQDNGMFDVSYAAAWELGRLLALQNAHFSTELFKWKKQFGKSTRKAMQMMTVPHLPGANRDHSPAPLPDTVGHWLKELALLKGIPFNYLVPDEELLPVESIRFFRIDKSWMQALADGALSIGGLNIKDRELDNTIIAEENRFVNKEVTGFIIRSEVVAGWPGMEVDGFNDKDKLVILRNETLSANVRLCLFEGELNTLSLHLKPEMLHFGLDGDPVKGYTKKWRNENGKEDKNNVVNVPIDTAGVLHVSSLLGNYKTTVDSSAHLAVQLMEGVECVRFQV